MQTDALVVLNKDVGAYPPQAVVSRSDGGGYCRAGFPKRAAGIVQGTIPTVWFAMTEGAVAITLAVRVRATLHPEVSILYGIILPLQRHL